VPTHFPSVSVWTRAALQQHPPLGAAGVQGGLHPPRCPQDPRRQRPSLRSGGVCPKPGHDVLPGRRSQRGGTCCFSARPGGLGKFRPKGKMGKNSFHHVKAGRVGGAPVPCAWSSSCSRGTGWHRSPPRCRWALTHGASHAGWGLRSLCERGAMCLFQKISSRKTSPKQRIVIRQLCLRLAPLLNHLRWESRCCASRGEEEGSELMEWRASSSSCQLETEPGAGKGCGRRGRGPAPAARTCAALAAGCDEGEAIHHRITESQNSRGWKGPLWVI